MPSKVYALDEAQNESVTVRWGWFWKNFTVLQDGQVIGQLTTADELKQGASFPLRSGQELTARLQQKLGSQELELLLDGRPLPGSATHPQQQLRQGLGVLLFLGLINVVLGVVAEAMQVEVLLDLGLGWASAVVGLIYLGLRWWGKAKITPWAFYIALGLLVLDVVMLFVTAASAPNGVNPTSGLFMRFFLGVILFRAAEGARNLRQDVVVAA